MVTIDIQYMILDIFLDVVVSVVVSVQKVEWQCSNEMHFVLLQLDMNLSLDR